MKSLANGTPYWNDTQRSISLGGEPLFNWKRRGDWTVGLKNDPNDVLAYKHSTGQLYTVDTGDTQLSPGLIDTPSGLIVAISQGVGLFKTEADLVATAGSGNFLIGAKRVGARKTGSAVAQVAGGNRRGVLVTDPAGRQTMVPFESGGTGFLKQDGTFDDPDIQLLLNLISGVRGSILYRGAAGWAALGPGTLGYALLTQGAGADPLWGEVAASGGGSITDGYWAPVTAGDPFDPQLVSDSNGDIVMVFRRTP
jgi:hypothetical protein